MFGKWGRMVVTLLVAGLLDSPLWAESRSAMVRVSCTILPMLELSTPLFGPTASDASPRSELGLSSDGGAWVSVKTNLGSNYRMTENFRKTSQGVLKIYSVTAL